MRDLYLTTNENFRRTAPFLFNNAADNDIQTVACTAINTEGYFEEFDVKVPLLPESQLPYDVIVHTTLTPTFPAFVAGEVLTGDAANNKDIKLIRMTQMPVPGFVRGEVITAAGGATAIVARRYVTEDTYLVYDVDESLGAWGGNVTGASGGGATTPGTVASNEAFRAHYDSNIIHGRNISKVRNIGAVYSDDVLIRGCNMLPPPGASIVGVTSGETAVVNSITPPGIVATLLGAKVHSSTLVGDYLGVMLRVALMYGDACELLNPIAANGIENRMRRQEMIFIDDHPHKTNESTDMVFDFGGAEVSGKWNTSTSYIANTPQDPNLGEPFADTIILRLYVSGNLPAEDLSNNIVFRRLVYNEGWRYLRHQGVSI